MRKTRTNPLDETFFRLSRSDVMKGLDLVNGTLITAAIGAGKTANIGRQIAVSLLRAGCGGLILTTKAEEIEMWQRYAAETGRSEDLVIFSADSAEKFDPFHWEFTREGKGAGDSEVVIDMLTTLVQIGRNVSSSGGDQFFERGNEMLMRAGIHTLALAQEPISIPNISRFVSGLPMSPGEYATETWQQDSYCADLLSRIRDRKDDLSPQDWNNLDMASRFICNVWPCMDERPRSSILMTFAGMADKLLYSPIYDAFCSGSCTFNPRQVAEEGKIVVSGFPMLEYGYETGRLVSAMLKLSFQQHFLRRKISDDSPIAMLWQDEFQYHILPRGRDNAFLQTSRGYRIATVAITQTINNIAAELNENQAGAKTKALCANLANKFFGQSGCPENNKFSADTIGKEYRYLNTVNMSSSDTSLGRNEQYLHKVDPDAFSQLIRPDGENPIAGCIVYAGGKTFNDTRSSDCPGGRNWLLTGFSR